MNCLASCTLPPAVVVQPSFFVVTIGDKKHTLRDWAEVSQLCARAFVADHSAEVTIKRVWANDPVGG